MLTFAAHLVVTLKSRVRPDSGSTTCTCSPVDTICLLLNNRTHCNIR